MNLEKKDAEKMNKNKITNIDLYSRRKIETMKNNTIRIQLLESE
jgi:hypothetical protein